MGSQGALPHARLLECRSAASPAALMPPPPPPNAPAFPLSAVHRAAVSAARREKSGKSTGDECAGRAAVEAKPAAGACSLLGSLRGLKLPPGKGFRGNRSNPNMVSSPSVPLSIANFSCVASKKNCSAKSQGLALKISARPLYCKIKASSLLNTPLIRTVRNICNHVKLE